MSKKILAAASALIAGAALMAAPASAQGVKVGTLNCNVEGGWGFVLGSQKELNCSYVPTKGETDRYNGEITKVGVDIGYTRGGVLVWAVIAPTSTLEPGVLEGSYGGVSASATAIVGAGANVLIGGLDKSITLQPISIEGNTGLNVAAGISAMNLRHVKGD